MKKKIGDYLMEEKIGSGAFGEVYRAVNVTSKITYAVKMLSKAKMPPRVRSYLDREVDILQRVESDYVVKLKDLKVSEHNYYLIFEYCNGGDLAGYRRSKGGQVSEAAGRRIIKQIVSALSSLYALNGIHRDIKLSNVLLHYPTKEHKDKDEPISKLCDFGFARLIEDPDSEMPVEMSIVGTPLNMSPEMIQRKPYTIKSDLWSLGTIVYELLCGKPTFMGVNKEHLSKVIELGEYKISKDVNLSTEAVDFINSCIQHNPSDRLGWKQLMTHPFICTGNITPLDFAKVKAANHHGLYEDKCHYILSSKVRYNFAPLYKKSEPASVKVEPEETEEKKLVENEEEENTSPGPNSEEEKPEPSQPAITEAEGLLFEDLSPECVKVDEGDDIDSKLKSEYVLIQLILCISIGSSVYLSIFEPLGASIVLVTVLKEQTRSDSFAQNSAILALRFSASSVFSLSICASSSSSLVASLIISRSLSKAF
eukprot:TRINITY_DN135196_c0_g1_i1.p1 TRINITY_DN135196_c0_g1~~TRINITY_DN135196_c0_g1_i1.p1  ORF type:complete len:481 (-),score=46.15 TRINITY_DN135196_c0_g1_i1:1157-2599(-)